MSLKVMDDSKTILFGIFTVYDVNKKGYLSEEQFRIMLLHFLPQKPKWQIAAIIE